MRRHTHIIFGRPALLSTASGNGVTASGNGVTASGNGVTAPAYGVTAPGNGAYPTFEPLYKYLNARVYLCVRRAIATQSDIRVCKGKTSCKHVVRFIAL